MEEKKELLALMHCGVYVDDFLLHKGIYSCGIPKLYNSNTTIDILKERACMAKDMSGNKFVSDEYLENLSKCELIKVSLTIDNG